MPPSNRSLDPALQRCAKQEPGGLEQVYQHIAPSIQALAQSVLENEKMAGQVLHETMVLIWQHARQFNPVYGSSQAWVFSIFRYRLQALQRQTDVKQPGHIRLAQHWLNNTSPWHERFEAPFGALLNEDMARVIALAYCKGLNADEIASVLGIEAHALLLELNTVFNRARLGAASPTQHNSAQIALYVLGLLNSQQAATVQAAIAQEDDALKQALAWEAVFFQLVQYLPAPKPNEATWEKIQKTLNITIIPQPLKTPEKTPLPTNPTPISQAQPASIGPEPTVPPPPPRTRHTFRIVATAVLALLTTAALYIWLAPIEPDLSNHDTAHKNVHIVPEPISLHAAVLQPPGSSSTPGWLIVSREPGVLHLAPFLKSQIAENESLVLWRRQPNSPATQKLGIITDTAPSKIHLASGFSIVEPMLYEITIERNPAELSEPEGDIAFIGQSFRLKVPDPEPEAPVAPAQ